MKLLTDGNVQHEGVRYRIFKGWIEWNPTRHMVGNWWPLGWQQIHWAESWHRENILPLFSRMTLT